MPRLHHRDAVAKAQRLVDIVAHIEDRPLVGIEQAHEILLEHAFQMGVQGAEGLVQHEDAGPGRQHARQRHALLLSARELRRIALAEAAQAEAFQFLGDDPRPLFFSHLAPDAGADIVGHGEVREEHVVLEQQRRLALLWREVHPCCRVEEHPVVHDDAPLIGGLDAGDAAQGEALAAPRSSEKAQGLVSGLEGHIQRERAVALANVHRKAHRAPPSTPRAVSSKRSTAPPPQAGPAAVTSVTRATPRLRPRPPRRPSRGGFGERPSDGAFSR